MLYSNKRNEHDELEVAHQGKQNVRAACPKDKLRGIQVFLWALSTMVYHGCILMFCYSVLYVT